MTLQQQIRANRLRSAVVMFAFVALVVVLAAVVGAAFDRSLGIFVLVAGVVYALFSILNSRRMVTSLTHAQPTAKTDDPELYRTVENVSIAAGLKATPAIYVVDDPAPNAFAAGLRPETSVVAVTTGLRRLMTDRELEGVIAHEIAHVRNRDTRLMTLAAVLAGVVAMISDLAFRMAFFGRRRESNPAIMIALIVGLVLAPIAALMLQMGLSRRREYLADASAAAILNDAEAVALALRKLQLDTQTVRFADTATAHLFIESPVHRVRGAGAMFGRLFETHPPLESRIAALEQMGGFRLPPV